MGGVDNADSTGAGGHRLHFLVVDDDEQLRRVFERRLGMLGRVSITANGKEAVALLEGGEQPDVILLDLMMPEMSGPEMISWLEANRPELLRRVIIMTGHAHSPEARDCWETTRQPRLEKPFTIADLDRVLAQIIGAGPRS